MRHAEFGVIVPVGIVAALYSILVGSFEDVALALGRTWYRGDVLTRVWYWTILSGLGALFCAYFAVKARFTLIRILASFMAVGLASRVVMTWSSPTTHVRSIAVLRLLVSGVFLFGCYFYVRRWQRETPSDESEPQRLKS
jgi:hypothetical protein